VTTFIPFDFGRPAVDFIFAAVPIKVVGEGDNRGFNSTCENCFRTRQLVTVVVGSDPIIVDEAPPQIGNTHLHVLDSFGVIGPIAILSVPGLGTMDVTATRIDEDSILLHLSGSAHTRFLPSAQSIDWCYTITINDPPGGPPSYSINGGNDDYPAYEVYINGTMVHGSPPTENNLALLFGGCNAITAHNQGTLSP
jgi:hypothetical protein